MPHIGFALLIDVNRAQTLPTESMSTIASSSMIALVLCFGTRVRSVLTASHHVASFRFHDWRTAGVVRTSFGKGQYGRVRCQLRILDLLTVVFVASETLMPFDGMTVAQHLCAGIADIVPRSSKVIHGMRPDV